MRLDEVQRHWERAISAFAWKVNAAAWLDRASPGIFAIGVSAGFGAYALRRSRGEDWALWWTGCAFAFVGVGFWAWWRSRGSFFRARDARALLEHQLGLNSALSAASGGVARWPTPRALPSVLRWRAPATLGWLAGAAALVLAGLVLPLPSRPAAEYRRGAEKPPALAEAEAWLEQLAAKEVARPEDVERLAEMARGLGERTPEERYSHSALEAADTLRTQTAQAIRGLGASLEEAAQALSPLERPGQLSDEELGAVAARLGEALRGLREGPLAAREQMARELAEAAKAAGFRSLSPEQAARLRQQLSKSGRAATGVLGAQGQGASIASADPDAPMRSGPGEGFGSGGINRGPGHAPMMFRDEASAAGEGRTETVGGDDLSRAALGDLLGMERGEHEFDPKRSAASSAAGAIASPAQGGEVVWVDRLSPSERAALKDFFK